MNSEVNEYVYLNVSTGAAMPAETSEYVYFNSGKETTMTSETEEYVYFEVKPGQSFVGWGRPL